MLCKIIVSFTTALRRIKFESGFIETYIMHFCSDDLHEFSEWEAIDRHQMQICENGNLKQNSVTATAGSDFCFLSFWLFFLFGFHN